MWSEIFYAHLQTMNFYGRSIDKFSRTTKVICDQAFLPAKSQRLVTGYQGNKWDNSHTIG